MACYPMGQAGQRVELPARKRRALDTLLLKLTDRVARVTLDARGRLAIRGWDEVDRDGLCDVCAVRLLTGEGSSIMRNAIIRAEVEAGRELDRSVLTVGGQS